MTWALVPLVTMNNLSNLEDEELCLAYEHELSAKTVACDEIRSHLEATASSHDANLLALRNELYRRIGTTGVVDNERHKVYFTRTKPTTRFFTKEQFTERYGEDWVSEHTNAPKTDEGGCRFYITLKNVPTGVRGTSWTGFEIPQEDDEEEVVDNEVLVN